MMAGGRPPLQGLRPFWRIRKAAPGWDCGAESIHEAEDLGHVVHVAGGPHGPNPSLGKFLEIGKNKTDMVSRIKEDKYTRRYCLVGKKSTFGGVVAGPHYSLLHN